MLDFYPMRINNVPDSIFITKKNSVSKMLNYMCLVTEDDTFKDLAKVKTTMLSSELLPPTLVLATGDDKQNFTEAISICHAPLLGAQSQK